MSRKVLFLLVVQLFVHHNLKDGFAFVQASATTPTSVLSSKKVVVVGGGPVGLYFAALLLENDPSVRIEILEKHKPSTLPTLEKKETSNAFGLGVGERMKNRLKDIPGLYEKATSVSSIVGGINIPLVSRDDLVTNMRIFLQDRCNKKKISKNCKVSLGEGCTSVDFQKKKVTTDRGRVIHYDLLLGADGVNSKIRQFLIDQTDDAALEEEHFTQDVYWKAIQLPKQPDLEVDSFKPLHHPAIMGGRVLPKAPEGHFLMLYWNGKLHDPTTDNPIGIRTAEDWRRLLKDAMQDKESWFQNSIRKLIGYDYGMDSYKKDREVVFDEKALADFVNSRAKPSHYLLLERYHYHRGSVALIGDSAHSFNSMLGQGCATALESTSTLVKCLLESGTTLDDALSKYTELATIESHAMTEVSLISYAMRGGWNAMTFKAMPLILWNMMRGKGLLKRIRDIHVPFSTIARENRRVLVFCRKEFEKERKPFARR